METKHIQAIGNFLSYYETDLAYIKSFQDFKNKKGNVNNQSGSFYSFLVEFRVIRNFVKGKVDDLLIQTYDWITSDYPDDVDKFAQKLSSTKLTRGNVMGSMASKILFLNNPWEIIPMDRLARQTLKVRQNEYFIYKEKLQDFKEANRILLQDCLGKIEPFATFIENKFNNDLQDLEIIRANRMIDKILWTLGKQ